MLWRRTLTVVKGDCDAATKKVAYAVAGGKCRGRVGLDH